MNKNDNNDNTEHQKVPHRFIRALLRQPVDKTPVWMMRQAGRYLPEFRQLRQRVPDFMTFCKTTELAVEATLQPLARFPLDAAIVFNDILTLPAAMGMDLVFQPSVGPVIYNPLRKQQDIDQLSIPDIEENLNYVLSTISLARKALNNRVPLIGFAGSPWTCAAYMVEGGSSQTFGSIKKMLYQNPALLHQLLQKLTQATIDYLNAQIVAGAQVIMVFDTWGGILGPLEYERFSLYYMAEIANKMTRVFQGQKIPLIFFTKGGGLYLEAMAQSGCDAVGLDWTVNLAQARQRVGKQVALQGNLDPSILFAPPNVIEQKVKELLHDFGQGMGHVMNLGHGIYPDTPVEHVAVMVDAVHQYGIRD